MSAEKTWDRIISALTENPVEVKTIPSNMREPLWFYAYIEDGDLYVDNANEHKPSCNMSQRRKIVQEDFLNVYTYYQRWASGERNVRQEVRTISRNTAYIFALIARFE